MSDKNTFFSILGKDSSRLVLLSWFISLVFCFIAEGAEKPKSLMRSARLPGFSAKEKEAAQAEAELGHPDKTRGVILWGRSPVPTASSGRYGSNSTGNQSSTNRFGSFGGSSRLGNQSSLGGLKQGLGSSSMLGNAGSRFRVRQFADPKSGLGGGRTFADPQSGLGGHRTFANSKSSLGGTNRFSRFKQGLGRSQSSSMTGFKALGNTHGFSDIKSGLGMKSMFGNMKSGLGSNSLELEKPQSSSSTRILNY